MSCGTGDAALTDADRGEIITALDRYVDATEKHNRALRDAASCDDEKVRQSHANTPVVPMIVRQTGEVTGRGGAAEVPVAYAFNYPPGSANRQNPDVWKFVRVDGTWKFCQPLPYWKRTS